jgi:hypothetical protein
MIEGLLMLAAIARGVAQADASIERGLDNLRVQVAMAPEWKTRETQTGHSYISAERAQLAGMLAHLEAAHYRNPTRPLDLEGSTR